MRINGASADRGGAIDASNACPPGMTIAYDRGGGSGLSGTGMITMSEQSIRNGAMLKPGTLFPNPWDLTLSGQNVWQYSQGTRTEDRARQGCDPSAASSAGMARAAAMLRPPQNTQTPTRPRLTYCGPNVVLTKGSTLDCPRCGQCVNV